jgi:DNA-binding response OmpR family regulator
MSSGSKHNRGRLLLVEDELMIALELQSIIEREGYDVIGPIRDIDKALAHIENDPPSMALLDANLEGKSSGPIAEALRLKCIPFGVVTGYPHLRDEHAALRGAPYLEKPYSTADVVRLLHDLSLKPGDAE